MSYTIHLSNNQFAILQDLINRGMDDKLAPYDNIIVDEETEVQIQRILDAAAFFNSHSVTGPNK